MSGSAPAAEGTEATNPAPAVEGTEATNPAPAVEGTEATTIKSTEERAARLREARRVLCRATRASARHSGDPGDPYHGRMVPVAAPLRPVLPGGGLRAGSTVAVSCSGSFSVVAPGSSLGSSPKSLVFALLSEASAHGVWCALVGMPEVGLVAAEEAGLVLSRLALVPRPGSELVPVVAALLDGVDVVAVAGVERLRAGDRQRLAAKARQRGAVLVPVGPWPGADLELAVSAGRWHGLVGGGAGRLRYRRALVRVGGRGAAARRRAVSVLLPGQNGAVSTAESSAELAGRAGMREAG